MFRPQIEILETRDAPGSLLSALHDVGWPGDFAVAHHKAVAENDPSSWVFGLVDGVKLKDATVKATTKLSPALVSSFSGLALRYNDGSAYVAAIGEVPNSTLRFAEIGIYQNGILSTIPGHSAIFIPQAPDDVYTIKFQASGDTLRMWVNGKLIETATSTALPNAGGVGIVDMCQISTFSKLSVGP